MSIPLDQYTTAIGVDFITRSYVSLGGNDLFFAISTSHNMIVKQSTNSTIQTLATDVLWMATVTVGGVTQLYYTTSIGSMYYAPFTLQNLVSPITPSVIPGVSSFYTFSVCYAPNSTPPAYVLVVDDGVRHTMYASESPAFTQPILGRLQVFNNSIDPLHYTSNPVVGIHPNDTSNVVINCEQLTISTQTTKVGFYAVAIPGVS